MQCIRSFTRCTNVRAHCARCQFVNRKTRMLMCLRLQTCAVQFPQINFVFFFFCSVCSMNEMSAEQVLLPFTCIHIHNTVIMCDTVSSSVKMDWPQNWNYINTRFFFSSILYFVLFCLLKYVSACEIDIVYTTLYIYILEQSITQNLLHNHCELYILWPRTVICCFFFCFGDNRMR